MKFNSDTPLDEVELSDITYMQYRSDLLNIDYGLVLTCNRSMFCALDAGAIEATDYNPNYSLLPCLLS